jgi:hypothetical protein
LKEEGVRGWYRGFVPTVSSYLPNWAIYFGSYHHIRQYLSQYFGTVNSPSSIADMLAAMTSGGKETL